MKFPGNVKQLTDYLILVMIWSGLHLNTGLAKYLKNMESNGLHVLRKMESQSFFSESSVCIRVMKRRGPCTLWLIKKGVPLYENWVQVILFLP